MSSIYTIGFTNKSANKFFDLIKASKASILIDTRLNNISQLAGFTKKEDLKYFLKELCNVDYVHLPDLAPTKEILKPYKEKTITWQQYEEKFLDLMSKRNIEKHIKPEVIQNNCLLCSEHQPHLCHRRLVAEYFKLNWQKDQIDIKHLI